MFEKQTILHPTDFSEHSAEAFRWACRLAREEGAELLVLHVAPPYTPPVGADAIVIPPEQSDPENQDAKQKELDALEPPLGGNLKLETELRIGAPVDEILAVCQERNPAVIVMGTHGRTGLSRLLLGSTAEAVLRRAPCPVLTVKLPEPSSQTQSPVGQEAGAVD